MAQTTSLDLNAVMGPLRSFVAKDAPAPVTADQFYAVRGITGLSVEMRGITSLSAEVRGITNLSVGMKGDQ